MYNVKFQKLWCWFVLVVCSGCWCGGWYYWLILLNIRLQVLIIVIMLVSMWLCMIELIEDRWVKFGVCRCMWNGLLVLLEIRQQLNLFFGVFIVEQVLLVGMQQFLLNSLKWWINVFMLFFMFLCLGGVILKFFIIIGFGLVFSYVMYCLMMWLDLCILVMWIRQWLQQLFFLFSGMLKLMVLYLVYGCFLCRFQVMFELCSIMLVMFYWWVSLGVIMLMLMVCCFQIWLLVSRVLYLLMCLGNLMVKFFRKFSSEFLCEVLSCFSVLFLCQCDFLYFGMWFGRLWQILFGWQYVVCMCVLEIVLQQFISFLCLWKVYSIIVIVFRLSVLEFSYIRWLRMWVILLYMVWMYCVCFGVLMFIRVLIVCMQVCLLYIIDM